MSGDSAWCPHGCGPLDAPKAMAPDTALLRCCNRCGFVAEVERREATTRVVMTTNGSYAGGRVQIGTVVKETPMFVIYDEIKTNRRVKRSKADARIEIVPLADVVEFSKGG